MPKVAVLSPFHNRAGVAARTLASISAQTLQDFEALIWDDASTDGTWDALVAASNSLSDPRIQVYRHISNVGLTKGLNDALSRTEAEFIAIVGSGDECDPRRLSAQVAALEANPQASFCASRSVTIDAVTGAHFTDESFDGSIIERSDIATACPFTHGTVMYRRTALVGIGGYEEGFVWCADWDVFFRLLDNSVAVYLDETLYRRYALPDGVSFNPTKAFTQISYKHLALKLSRSNSTERQETLGILASQGIEAAIASEQQEVSRDLARRNIKLYFLGRREAAKEMEQIARNLEVQYPFKYRVYCRLASLLGVLPINGDTLIRFARKLRR